MITAVRRPASIVRARVMAGLSRAKADGTQLGRRRLEDSDADKVAAIVAAPAKGTGIRRIAQGLRVGVGTVLRVTGEGVKVLTAGRCAERLWAVEQLSFARGAC